MATTVNSNPYMTQVDAPELPQEIMLGGSVSQPIPAAYAARRARDGEFGLKDSDILTKRYMDLYAPMTNGEDIEAKVAAEKNEANRRGVEHAISAFNDAATQPQVFSLTDLNKLRKDLTPEHPGTVFERNYAQQYMSELEKVGLKLLGDDGTSTNWYFKTKQEEPAAVGIYTDLGQNYIATRQFLLKKFEEAQEAAKNQSWGAYALNVGESLVPGVTDFRLRGRVAGSPFFGGGLRSQNLDAQADIIYRASPENAAGMISNAVDPLIKSDPALAMDWLHSMIGKSSSEKLAANIMNAFDVQMLSGIGLKSIKTVGGLIQMKQMVKQIIKGLDERVPPNVAAPAAIGDLEKAGLAKSQNRISDELKGLSKEELNAIDDLTGGLNTDLNAKLANPGGNGREVAARMAESDRNVIANLTNALIKVFRVQRIPDAIETATKAIWDGIKYTYPGLRNRILEMMPPVRNRLTNTYDVAMHLGTHQGDVFYTHESAVAAAKLEGLTLDEAGGQVTFRSGRSVYTFEKDGSITRPGIKPGTSFIFVSPETAQKLGKLGKAFRYMQRQDGNIDVFTPGGRGEKGKFVPWSVKPEHSNLPASSHPSPGLHPIELHPETVYQGTQSFMGHNIRPAISDIGKTASERGYTIEPLGIGFYIRVVKPLRETDDIIRDAILSTLNTKRPDSWMNAFLGWMRTPDETLAFEDRMQRKLATYGPAALMKVMKESIKEIQELRNWGYLNRTKWDEWKRTIEASRDLPDPNIPGKKGYFYENPVDLETYYQQNFKRAPHEREIEAYFAHKRYVELDRVIRNLNQYRNMSRLGAEMWRVKGLEDYSPWMEGVAKREVGGSGTVLFVKKTGEHELIADDEVHKLVTANAMNKKMREDIKDGVKTGRYKAFEIYAPEMDAIHEFSPMAKNAGARVRYVVAEDVENKPLSYDLIPRRGGGHFEYDYEHYIKQAKIRPETIGGSLKFWYEGDTTVMPISLRAMGVEVATHLNQVRELLRKGQINAAKDYAGKNLPMPWDDLKGWFMGGKDTLGRKYDARLSLTEPIKVIGRNQMIGDIDDTLAARYTFKNPDGSYKTLFKDGTRSGSLNKQFQIQFTGERDAYEVHTFNNYGSKNNPLFKYEPAELVDPITTMNRSISRIVNSTFMDDYKIYAVEHWLQRAKQWLKEDDLNAIRSSPFYQFERANLEGAFKPDAPPEIVTQLLNERYQAKQLFGIPSTSDTVLHSFANKIADSIYTNLGPKGMIIDPVWALSRINDPVRFMRSVAFHTKLGMFNWVQLWVQSQTFVTIMGVAGPGKAVPAVYATFLHQLGRINPKMIDKLDDLATKMNVPGFSKWKPGEFKEAMSLLNEGGGFGTVAGEYAAVDNAFNPKIIKNGLDQILDAGTVFFTGAERNVRYGAWYTAYREFRDKYPVGRIADNEYKQILERADMLNVNMSRASNSIMQHGVLSIPLQFLTYQVRAAELFMGKRLTAVEKARLAGMYTAVYGLPAATGVTGIPLGDLLRKNAIENGYVVGDKYIDDLVMNGIPATLGRLVTGNTYNVGDRYGGQGFEFIREVMRGDKTMWGLMGGAAGSIFYNTFVQSDGFRAAMMSGLRDDGHHFPIKTEDFADILKEISSFNNVWRQLAALNTMRWLSKKDAYLSDTSKLNSIFMTLTGLQPQQVSDLNLLAWSRKDEKELQQHVQQKFAEEFRRGLMAQRDSNQEQATKFFTRAFTYLHIGGYPRDKIPEAISQAAKDNESMIKRVNWDFYLKNVNENRRSIYLDAIKRKLQVDERNK